MRYKRFFIEPSANYAATIFRCPEQLGVFDFTLHWHRDYEFIYVEKGPLKLQKTDRQIILGDGEVYFLNSDEVHSYVDVNENLHFIVVNISPKILQPYFEDPSKILDFEIRRGEAYEKIAHSMKIICNIKNTDDKLEILKTTVLLNTMAYFLIKDCKCHNANYVKGSDSGDFDCAKSAILFMEENFYNEISLSDIAAYVGMTPAHFSKYFKDKNGVTFSKYLRRIRLDHAIKDLRDSDISVKTAAIKNGFPNVNSLIITCKEIYGRTPLEMRAFVKT